MRPAAWTRNSSYDYFREEHGLMAETEPVAGLLALSQSAGWFAPHARLCWVCERPSVRSLDQEGWLHAEQGPALKCPDGWALYASEGAASRTQPGNRLNA